MERRLTHSLPAKVAAIFLVVILTVCMLFCALVELSAMEYGIYTQGYNSYYDTSLCETELINDLYHVQDRLDKGVLKLDGYYGDRTSCAIRFAGYDPKNGQYLSNDRNMEQALRRAIEEKGSLLIETADNTDNYIIVESFEDIFDSSLLPTSDEDGEHLYAKMQKLINEDLFFAGVVDPSLVRDSYFRGKLLFDLAYDLRVIAPVVVIVGAFVLAALLIFLCCAAGRRYGKPGIYRNLQDRIPLDIYLCAMLFLIIACMAGAMEQTYSYWNLDQLLFTTFILLVTILLGLATLLTLATRFKLGKWWRNTMLYYCWRLFLRFCRAIRDAWYNIKLTWRVAVVLFLLLLILPGMAGTLLYFLFALALIVCACSAARQLIQLKRAGKALAQGDFEQNIDTSTLHGELREHGDNLNSLGQGLSIAVDQRMRSERMKTELITNVSHDIKTPLTSIINYVDLLQKDPTPEEQAEYLAVLDRQAKRLKKLTEDLVEASKASTGNLSCILAPTNLREILDQALGEYEDRLTAAGLEPILTLPEKDLSVLADGRLLWRVLDNLLNNACKYAQNGTRLYLDGKTNGNTAVISMKNVSRQQLNLSPDELMERFVRGDASRNTEGSGLGLNIAKSLIELQNGTFELAIDGDLFKATVMLPVTPETMCTE